MRIIDLVQRLVTRQTDGRAIAIVRIIVGIAAIGFALESWVNFGRLLNPLVVHTPTIAWLPLPSQVTLLIFVSVWVVAAITLIIGLLARAASTVLFVIMVYTLLVDQQLYSNHLYLCSIFMLLLTLADSSAHFSLDAHFRGVRERIPEWPILLFKIQVSIVYFFAALLKLNPTYVSGIVMTQFWPFSNLASILPANWPVGLILQLAALGSISIELFLAFALWFPQLRWLALVVGIVFHVIITYTGGNAPGQPNLVFGLFAMETIAPYILFFDWPVRRVAVKGYSS